MHALIILLLLTLIIIYSIKNRSYGNAITFFALPLLISILIIEYVVGYSLSHSTVIYLFLYLLVYSLTAMSFKWLFIMKIKTNVKFNKFTINAHWLIYITFIFAPIYIFANRDFISQSISIDYSRSEESSSLFLAVIENSLNIIGLMCATIYAQTKKKIYLLPFVSILIIGIISASRAIMLIQAIALYVAFIAVPSRVKDKFSVYFISLTPPIFFIIIGVFRGSFSSDEPVTRVVLTYIFGGLIAFDQFLSNPEQASFSLNIAPGLIKIINIIGLDLMANNYKYEPIAYPVYTNIYSSFRELISDFGYSGSIIFAAIHGYLSQKSDSWIISFSYWRQSYAILIMTFNAYFLFYPITMFMFVIAFMIIVPFMKIKTNERRVLQQ